MKAPKLPRGFKFDEEPSCEHCGAMDRGTIIYHGGGVGYCLNCTQADPDNKFDFKALWDAQSKYQEQLAKEEAEEVLGPRKCFVQDESSHWYVIDVKDREEFEKWDEEGEDDKLIEKYGDMQLGMHPSNYEFLDPRETKK